MPFEMFQRFGDWFEQRAEYRKQALESLRKREGLPTPELIDGKMQYRQSDGTYSTMAVGTRKQEPRELADASWHSESEFQILDVAEDGRKLSDELKDLDRDSSTFELSQNVSHGQVSEQAPGFELAGTSDEEIDEVLQKFLKRGL